MNDVAKMVDDSIFLDQAMLATQVRYTAIIGADPFSQMKHGDVVRAVFAILHSVAQENTCSFELLVVLGFTASHTTSLHSLRDTHVGNQKHLAHGELSIPSA